MRHCPSVCNPQIIFPHHFQKFSQLDKGVRLKGRKGWSLPISLWCGSSCPTVQLKLSLWLSSVPILIFPVWFIFLVLINAVLPFTCTQCATEVTFLSQCFDHDTFLCNLYLVPCVHFKNKFLYTSWKLSKLHLPLVHCSLQRDWFHPSLPIFQMFRQKLCSSLTFCPHLSPCSQTCACIVTAAHGKSGE